MDEGDRQREQGERLVKVFVGLMPPVLFLAWAAAFFGGVERVVALGIWPPLILAVLWPIDLLLVGLAFRQARRERDGVATSPAGGPDVATVAGALLVVVGVAFVVWLIVGGDDMAAVERQVLGLTASFGIGIGSVLAGRGLLRRRLVPPGPGT